MPLTPSAEPVRVFDPGSMFGGVAAHVYWWTRDVRSVACAWCVDGTCLQKVMRSHRWDGDVVVHCRAAMLD